MSYHEHNLNPGIVGFGTHLPSNIVPNAELIEATGIISTPEKILELTGIRERRWAKGSEYGPEIHATMGTLAAQAALASAGVAPQKVSGLYASDIQGDYGTPDTAVLIHERLGLSEQCSAVKIGGACNGGAMATEIALEHTAHKGKPSLEVGISLMSRIADTSDRKQIPLFGDGAAAFVIDLHPAMPQFYTASITRPDRSAIGQTHGNLLDMDGHKVRDYAREMIPAVIKSVADEAGIYDTGQRSVDFTKISAIIPHPGNVRMGEMLRSLLKAPEEQFILSPAKTRGNTSAASIGFGLEEGYRNGTLKYDRLEKVLLVGIGAGMVATTVVVGVYIHSPD